MPEGHTLHRLALDLSEAFEGRAVRAFSPQGRFEAEAAQLDGNVVEGTEAWGKQLFIEFPGERYVHIHLGLYGKFNLIPYADGVPDVVGQVRLRLDSGQLIADLRGATACDLWTRAQVEACVAKLGPDPLRSDSDPDKAWRRISASSRSIGSLLMDQTVLAGVGNVYRAEVLFRHGLDPMRPGVSITRSQWSALWEDLVFLMKIGVERNRIDTVRDEHTPEAMGRNPRKDDHGGEVYVYRRATMACLVCESEIKTVELESRNLFWCPGCQKPYRSRQRTVSGGKGRL